MIQEVLVLGSGSAGLIAALSLKRKLPDLGVRIVRSPEIGVIGVGEGTTPGFPKHLFDYLGLRRKPFYQLAEPTWKLGIRFHWGTRGKFDYAFNPQVDFHADDLRMPNGFYCGDGMESIGLASALMAKDKAFPRQENGCPDIRSWHGFHIENEKLVSVLERVAREYGVGIIDGRVQAAELRPEGGVAAVVLDDGRRLEADFFVDASGFRSELLGKALEEPFESFGKALFCDRAVVGGWGRTDEPILPYTVAEEMDAGWAWQIEHEHHINRGYVFSSTFISDEDAAAEFLRKNPKAPSSPRIVKFRSGRYRRQWVENVVAIGNAGGFVEPLEATALMVVCANVKRLVSVLRESMFRPTPAMREIFNRQTGLLWEDIRDFLALHYKFNGAPDTAFWRHCRSETELGGMAALVDFYREHGPTGFCRWFTTDPHGPFGLEGPLVMLVGNQVPYEARYEAPEADRQRWEARRAEAIRIAAQGLTVKETLQFVRHPGWQWNSDLAGESGRD